MSHNDKVIFTVNTTPHAGRKLRKLPKAIAKTLVKKVKDIAKTDAPKKQTGVKKLTGFTDVYRIRKEDYRIVFIIYDSKKIINIIMAGHRKEVYDKIAKKITRR